MCWKRITSQNTSILVHNGHNLQISPEANEQCVTSQLYSINNTPFEWLGESMSHNDTRNVLFCGGWQHLYSHNCVLIVISLEELFFLWMFTCALSIGIKAVSDLAKSDG